MRTLIRQNRDLRIDFFRGVALWSMFIDHLIKSWFRAITLKQFAFCDSAEIFVLLSGISAGIVYKNSMAREGLFLSCAKIVRRMLAIYRTHLLLFVLVVAEAAMLVAWFHPPSLLQELNLERLDAHPFASTLEFVRVRYLPKFFDILPLYLFFLPLLGLVLPFLRAPKLVLALSASLYVVTRTLQLNLPGWQGFFNPLAWQVLYIAGVVATYVLSDRRNYWRGWDCLAVLFLLFGLVESHAGHLVTPGALLLHTEIDKSDLHPFRLAAILAFAWLAWRYLPARGRWLQSRFVAPFVLFGQHTLPVFAGSILFALTGEVILTRNPGWIFQLLVPIIGTGALLATAACFAWNTQLLSRKSRAAQLVRDEPLVHMAVGREVNA